jgi:serine/threonine-protein kinase RsbT
MLCIAWPAGKSLMPETQRIPINNELDIVAARVEARNLAKEMGFDIIDQARIATAISELARNVVLYAHNGQVTLNQLDMNGKIGLQIICNDQGPGIADTEQIMRHSHLVARETGRGLPGTKRLMDEFEIESQPERGTTVTVCKWLR